MLKVDDRENSRNEFELANIPQLLEKQCPTLVSGIQARYPLRKNAKPNELLEKFDELERKDQLEFLGWLYGGCNHFIDSLGFYFSMNYFNLSTLQLFKSISEKELEKATFEERLAFEAGYRQAMK